MQIQNENWEEVCKAGEILHHELLHQNFKDYNIYYIAAQFLFYFQTVFKIVGKCQSHGQNRAAKFLFAHIVRKKLGHVRCDFFPSIYLFIKKTLKCHIKKNLAFDISVLKRLENIYFIIYQKFAFLTYKIEKNNDWYFYDFEAPHDPKMWC